MSELRTNRIVPRDGLTSGTNNGGGIIQVRNIMYTDVFSSNHSNSGYVDVTGFNPLENMLFTLPIKVWSSKLSLLQDAIFCLIPWN